MVLTVLRYSFGAHHGSVRLPLLLEQNSKKIVMGFAFQFTRPQSSCSKKKSIIPDAPPPGFDDIELLHNFIHDSEKLVVLTGAGISTESGIPDYRSPNGAYSTGFKPMTYQEFMQSEKIRRRYWVRSYVGWRRFEAAQPGPTHTALAQLEGWGHIRAMITQNVDRLHHQAGSNPLELHGTTHKVICLACGHSTSRENFQERAKQLNPEWAASVEALERGDPGSDASFGMQQRPDGDAEIDLHFWEANFQPPTCEKCDGNLKPDVVLFGENLPKTRADTAMSLVAESDGMLVVGSSLMVHSAYRLAKAAYEKGAQLVIINAGPTRADAMASAKIECRSGEVFTKLLSMRSIQIPIAK